MERTPRRAPRARPRVVVTGAAGCVGRLLVDELVADGWAVTAVDRPGSDLPSGTHVRPLEADLTAPDAAARVVEGARAVVHAAAVVDIARSYEDLVGINLHATQRLYRAARDAGARLFVFFGTGSAYRPGPKPLAEDAPMHPSNGYVRTKMGAEAWLRAESGLPVNLLRPSLIFGPRGRVLAGALATLAPIVRLFTDRAVPFRGGPRCNWVHALDVARAAAFLVRSPQPHGEAFNVANDDPVGVGDVVTTALRAGGLTLHGPGIPWPTAAVRLAVEVVAGRRTLGVVNRVSRGLFDLATRRAGVTTPLEPRLDAEALGFAVRDVIFDNRKLKSLGFRYRYPRFEEGWAATIAWYRENGWIPAGGDAGDPAPPAPAIARG